MGNACISIERILARLDEYLNKNDYASAEKHLVYWRDEAQKNSDSRTEILVLNELMGLYRKLGKRSEALSCVDSALSKIEQLGIETQVGSATSFLNCATVYKAFGMAEQGLPLFGKAREIYEKELDENDSRLGGLYNNMALTLVDLGRFSDADELYRRAISVMNKNENGALSVAITYLNMASAAEAEYGLVDADLQIQEYLSKAEKLLKDYRQRDGYYAFVCEKCASVFEYYGHFIYARELEDRARRIYENERS